MKSHGVIAHEVGGEQAVIVRGADCNDVRAIMDLHARAKRPGGTRASYLAAVEDAKRLVVVACSGTEVIGWAKTHWWDRAEGPAPAGHYLGGVTVDPAWRLQGIGTMLTTFRLGWIWERADGAWYVVNATNLASIAMHQKFGFAATSRAAAFHTTTFEGGNGLLMHASRPIGYAN